MANDRHFDSHAPVELVAKVILTRSQAVARIADRTASQQTI